MNAANRLKTMRSVKTERSERKETEEMVVAGHVGGKKKVEEKDRWIQ